MVMIKSDLILEIVAKTSLNGVEAKRFLNAFIRISRSKLAEEGKISFPNFGVFYTVNMPERRLQNLYTKGLISVPAQQIIRFRAAKKLRDTVNKR